MSKYHFNSCKKLVGGLHVGETRGSVVATSQKVAGLTPNGVIGFFN
jgi:hypothetical protein